MDKDGIIFRMVELLAACNMSQADFAHRSASTPDKISKSFSGIRNFTATELAVASELGGTTINWILTGRHAASPSIAARADMKVAPARKDIEATLKRFTDAAERLELLDGPRVLPVLPQLKLSTRYVADGEQLALAARNTISNVIGESLLERIEKAFGIDIIVTPLPGGLSGCAWQSDSLRIIALDSGATWARQRFTLAHELGHILAEDAQVLIGEADDNAHSENITEKRANVFASRFLMPASELELLNGADDPIDLRTFASLVCRFRISPLSLSWRLFGLGIFDENQRTFWGRKSASGVLLEAGKASEATKYAAEAEEERIPPRVVQRHWELYKGGQISARPVAALLDMKSEEVRAIREASGN